MQEHEKWTKPWKTGGAWRAMAEEFGQVGSLPEDEEDVFKRAQEARADDERPNVLFVFTDQQTIRAMSCSGTPGVRTPNMDRLARRGVRFTQSYCTDPLCGPSRSSLVTGRMPHSTGVIYNGDTPDPDIPNVGHLFRRAGYETAWCGKWHLPESYVYDYDGIPGFDNIPHTRNMRNMYGLGDLTDYLHAMDAVFLLRWEFHKIGLPWLLAVSLHNPHDICHWTRIPDKPRLNIDDYPPLPENFDVPAAEPYVVRAVRSKDGPGNTEIARTHDWDRAWWRAYVQAYYHFTQQVDRAVGLILDALQEGGWIDNTLVIFTSDHGDGAASHRWAAKNCLYDEPTRVPFIISFPGRIPAGEVDRGHLISGLDIAPTMCDYAGIEGPKMVGRSLRPLFEETDPGWRDYVVSELTVGREAPMRGRMLRGRRYKYCLYSEGDRRQQLFDMVEDPGEMRNLAGDPSMQDVVGEHRAMLREWVERTGDPFRVDCAL